MRFSTGPSECRRPPGSSAVVGSLSAGWMVARTSRQNDKGRTRGSLAQRCWPLRTRRADRASHLQWKKRVGREEKRWRLKVKGHGHKTSSPAALAVLVHSHGVVHGLLSGCQLPGKSSERGGVVGLPGVAGVAGLAEGLGRGGDEEVGPTFGGATSGGGSNCGIGGGSNWGISKSSMYVSSK